MRFRLLLTFIPFIVLITLSFTLGFLNNPLYIYPTIMEISYMLGVLFSVAILGVDFS